MNSIRRHLARCCVAGLVTLMPLVGAILSVVVLERTLSESFLARQPFYFPGLAIIAAAIIVYGIGLIVSTFLGRWLFERVDRLLESVPAVGMLYQTLKQILGYGEGKDGMFREVVLVPSRDADAEELGLVTNDIVGVDGTVKWTVFVPGSPNPGAGRLLVVDPARVRRVDVPVSEALKTLVAVGKNPIDITRTRAGT